MPRLIGPAFLTALASTLLLALGSGQALATHVQCGDVITQDTTLDSDLIDCPGAGIVIGASNVTLDLDGHTVDGTGGGNPDDYCNVGIVSGFDYGCPQLGGERHDGVVVRGGVVRDFDFDVRLTGADEGVVRALEVSGGIVGIVLAESRGSVISGNRAFQNIQGITVDAVSRTVVSHNELEANTQFGIGGEGIDDSRVEQNHLTDSVTGVIVHSIERSSVSHNRAVGNAGAGLEISDGVFDTTIAANRVSGNGNGIVAFEGVHRTRVERNHVIGNGLRSGDGPGILVDGDTSVEANTVAGNAIGIFLFCCNEGNRIARNRIVGNGAGVTVESGGNQIEANMVSRSTHAGIQVVIPEASYAQNGNRLEGNRVVRNGGDGIVVGPGSQADATATIVARNVASWNQDDGIDIESAYAVVAQNRADRNGDLGIEAVAGVTDGGGNRAFANRNPLQCLNIVCR